MDNGTKIAIAVLIGAGVIAAGLYFGLRKTNPPPKMSIAITPYLTSVPTVPLATPTPKPPSPTPGITWTKTELLQALSQKTGIPKDKITFSISNKVPRGGKILLRGGVSQKGAIGGAGFFGYVDHQGVHITYSGQGVPKCSEVNPYDYPLSWADYCLNSQGQPVRRQ